MWHIKEEFWMMNCQIYSWHICTHYLQLLMEHTIRIKNRKVNGNGTSPWRHKGGVPYTPNLGTRPLSPTETAHSTHCIGRCMHVTKSQFRDSGKEKHAGNWTLVIQHKANHSSK
jgi:hypothetical protein